MNVICVLCDFNYANNFLIYIAQKNSHKNKVELCLASESLFHIETATIVDKNERYLSAMQLNYVGDHFKTCNRNYSTNHDKFNV